MLHEADRRMYWEAVEVTLEILEAPRELAAGFREDLEGLPVAAQELFYHEEPLYVAMDLAGLDVCTEAQERAYDERIASSYFK